MHSSTNEPSSGAALVASRPLCECHGEPKSWHPNKRTPSGGYWRCTIRRREINRADYHRNRDKRRAKIEEYKNAHHDSYLTYWRDRYRKRSGWYEDGGMATKPLRAKELA